MKTSQEKLQRLRSLSHLLDSKFEGPFGIRFGLDALIGFMPVIGDYITTAISVYIIFQAATLGAGTGTLIRMTLNLGFEAVIDLVPFIGNFFDIYWKANNRNITLLEHHLENPKHETLKSNMIIGLILIGILSLLSLSAYLTWTILNFLFQTLFG